MRKDNALIQISPYDGHPSKANINRELLMYIRLVAVLDFDLRYRGGNRMRNYAFCGTVFAVFTHCGIYGICGICGIYSICGICGIISVFGICGIPQVRYCGICGIPQLKILEYIKSFQNNYIILRNTANTVNTSLPHLQYTAITENTANTAIPQCNNTAKYRKYRTYRTCGIRPLAKGNTACSNALLRYWCGINTATANTAVCGTCGIP